MPPNAALQKACAGRHDNHRLMPQLRSPRWILAHLRETRNCVPPPGRTSPPQAESWRPHLLSSSPVRSLGLHPLSSKQARLPPPVVFGAGDE